MELEHTRVVFGVTTSPFLANRTLKELVKDEGAKYPLAARALNEQTFVDDILTGAKSKSEVLELKNQLIDLMKAGGFNLGKWASSNNDVVGDLTESLELPIGNSKSITKVLGMFWDKAEDTFQYEVNDVNEPATKRGILSRVARTYDINGYLSPFTFLLKSMIQKLWLLKIDWDDPLPDDLHEMWVLIKSQLLLLEEIKFPRYMCGAEISPCMLIGFSGASIMGMAAVIYLRVKSEGNYMVHLVASKTRVAPLKTLTFPKLELGAACLSSRLMNATIEALKSFINLADIFCFADSSSVLGWLKTPPYKLKTFISNRVVQIHENVPDVRWSYVPGKFNPADPANALLAVEALIDNEELVAVKALVAVQPLKALEALIAVEA
ncbi:uncharacterized protein LOC123322398 [Coccinella septempunctata]|uniref:uncharacterized protein LOC123322398 n=1 Tax=Coccinella septempunctata TaxID=41139 RepID=UPI001D07E590|nr:uncharacterized protein LOC123322398 [Coccinella septempunctata]